MVRFSSEEEVQDAIKSVGDGVLRVFLKTRGEAFFKNSLVTKACPIKRGNIVVNKMHKINK